jgi:KaiC/GvpD/RAD55 family RecA-like ATPase
MIKEFAFGLAQRHYFQDTSEIGNWMNIDRDTYMSLYEFDDSITDFFAKNKTLSGFDGLVYMPDEFILDIDGKDFDDLENARQKTIGLTLLLDDLDIPYRLYFSGNKGFHLGIPGAAFRWKPCKDLHLKVKDALTNAGIFEYADVSVTDKLRLIRIVNTKNLKARLWKCQITKNQLNASDIKATMQLIATKPGDVDDFDLECNPVFDVLEREKKDEPATPEFISQGRNPDPVNYPCISNMLSSNAQGERHATALRLSAWFRWLYPESIVRIVMEQWRQQVDDSSSPFTVKEMESIIKSAYESHGGQGNRYGCGDKIMDSHCQETCKLYKSKKNQAVMDSSSMENALIDFYRLNRDPLNLGTIFEGENFPIYPGEVVVIQAPPKSMKTMLLQNIVNGLKRPTYFIEMEMSPRQIWSRFVQIEMGWSEDDLKSHYQQMQNGMDKRFKWLTVDYSSPYASELEKRIMMLPVKPEIVVVDHMGLFKSKQRDPNMKTEEASQAMMELAVRHNLIIFTVSEITKSAFHEGNMNMASAKGSFRTAYNTNKLLSVIPSKSRTTGLIEYLRVRCEANREREHLDVSLRVENNRIFKENTREQITI